VAPGAPACGGLSAFPLDVPHAELESLAVLLSADERARAARFRNAAHGSRFIVAHGRLRQILAAMLGIAPAELQFAAGTHGKPSLAAEFAASGLCFNLSHSDALGLLGWAWRREIGVDVEAWRQMNDEAALVRRYFSQAEITAWEAVSPAQRSEAFFNIWTRKEAYVKAVGRGLGLALDSFDVSLESGPAARLLRPSTLIDDGRSWSLASPNAGPGASLAVALQAETLYVAPVIAPLRLRS
jgi:4'-phosphopantetheinyl transferase